MSNEMKNPRARLTLCGVVLVVVTAAAPGAVALAAAAELPGQVLEVAVKSGRLSVRAHQARLADVLEAVGRQAGVSVLLRGDLEAPVTETFVNVPLDEGIRRLTRWHSVVLVYDPSPGTAQGVVLTNVWVTGSSPGPGRAEPAARGAQRNDDARADARPLAEPEGWARDLTTSLKTVDPGYRRRTIERLTSERGADAVLHALREAATRDPAPLVRRAAIQILASMNSPDAADAVRATLDDPHPGVRYEAHRALAQQSRARLHDGSVD